MRRKYWWVVSAAVLACALEAPAGRAGATVTTGIVANGFGTLVSKTGATYTISGGTLSGGRLAPANLFESFSYFSLAAGATADWTYCGAPTMGISNIINRVTGGAVSYISGTLALEKTAFPNAAFYFINPAGIVFGRGANLNFPAAAYFSTSKALMFRDGLALQMTTPAGSTLSMAPPTAFGFLGGEGDIIMDSVNTGGSTTPWAPHLFLAAGNLNFTNDTQLYTGGLTLVTTGGQLTNVSIADPLANTPIGGSVRVIGSPGGMSQQYPTTLSTEAINYGGIDIITGNIYIDGGNLISTGPITINGGGNVVVGDSGAIATNAAALANAETGNIYLTAASVTVESDGSITSETRGVRPGGAIFINAPNIDLLSGGAVRSNTFGSGSAGDELLNATNQVLVDGGTISASTAGSGPGGDVSIIADTVTVQDAGRILTNTSGLGPGGDITITALTTLAVQSSGAIVASTFGAGHGGAVTIAADHLTVQSGGDIEAATEYQQDGAMGGDTGDITVKTTNLTIQSGGDLRTDTSDASSAGDISIKTGALLINGPRSGISSTSNAIFSGGLAGDITIASGPVTLSDGGAIATVANSGPAGDITLTILDGARLILEGETMQGEIITASADNTGGTISISGPSAIVMNGGIIQTLGVSFDAFVNIDAGVIIESDDRPNGIQVRGIFDSFDEAVIPNVAFEDASKVLNGPCALLRARGETSQFGTKLSGPYQPRVKKPLVLPPPPAPTKLASQCGAAAGAS